MIFFDERAMLESCVWIFLIGRRPQSALDWAHQDPENCSFGSGGLRSEQRENSRSEMESMEIGFVGLSEKIRTIFSLVKLFFSSSSGWEFDTEWAGNCWLRQSDQGNFKFQANFCFIQLQIPTDTSSIPNENASLAATCWQSLSTSSCCRSCSSRDRSRDWRVFVQVSRPSSPSSSSVCEWEAFGN